jgi:xanthine/uracil/vitamin C permease (AzgA family)
MLHANQVRTGMLLTIVGVTIVAWSTGLADHPTKVFDIPRSNRSSSIVSFTDWNANTYQGLFTLIYTDILLQTSCVVALMSITEVPWKSGSAKDPVHGARFSTGIYSRGCHWFPCLLA